MGEYEELTASPETLTVGQLNEVVRALRERLHQKSIEAQQAQAEYNPETGNVEHPNAKRMCICGCLAPAHSGHVSESKFCLGCDDCSQFVLADELGKLKAELRATRAELKSVREMLKAALAATTDKRK
jgi:hypothetical protein